VSGEVAGTIVHKTYNKTIIQREQTASVGTPQIHSPQVAAFFVRRPEDKDSYDLGFVIKLFNLGSNPHLIEGIALEPKRIDIVGRGSWYIQTLSVSPPAKEVIRNRYIKAGDVGYYKLLLAAPTAIHMTPTSPSPPNPTPEIKLTGRWWIGIGGKKIAVAPEFESVAEFPLSQDEWQSLLSPGSKIDVENLKYEVSP
jgi:hypothetical protein